jgi:DNA-binding response OmpR family regulator
MTGKHVLVVEDDFDAQQIYSATLKHSGYVVVTASTVHAARSAVRERKPDIVTLDCRLPDGNGLDLLATWRQPRHEMSAVPVVVVTAFSEREHFDAATAAGADAFIVKPCPPDALVAFLARIAMAAKPTRRLPRVRMDDPQRAPPIVFPCGRPTETATLHRIDASRFQALCATCMRPSPVVRGDIQEALREVVGLGWITTRLGSWACPICRTRVTSRGAA